METQLGEKYYEVDSNKGQNALAIGLLDHEHAFDVRGPTDLHA